MIMVMEPMSLELLLQNSQIEFFLLHQKLNGWHVETWIMDWDLLQHFWNACNSSWHLQMFMEKIPMSQRYSINIIYILETSCCHKLLWMLKNNVWRCIPANCRSIEKSRSCRYFNSSIFPNLWIVIASAGNSGSCSSTNGGMNYPIDF